MHNTATDGLKLVCSEESWALLRVAIEDVADDSGDSEKTPNRGGLQRRPRGRHVEERQPKRHEHETGGFDVRAGGDAIPGGAERQDDDERSGNQNEPPSEF